MKPAATANDSAKLQKSRGEAGEGEEADGKV